MGATESNRNFECPKCGCTHFQDVVLHQYRGPMYTSALGGELGQVGEGVHIQVCACGHPALVSSHDALMKLEASMLKALLYRQRREPEGIMAQIAEGFAPAEEFRRLAEKVNSLATVVKNISGKISQAFHSISKKLY